jgi:hypothetical protein
MTYRPTFEVDDALSMRLAALAQPAVPRDLTGIVMARIARIEDADAEDGSVAAPTGELRERSAARGWPAAAAAAAVVGLAAGLALVVSGYGAPINIVSPLDGGLTEGLVSMPATASAAAILTVGVVLYTAGLFAPLRVRSRM